MKPMYENSGKSAKSGRIGRIFCSVLFAEDPEITWLFRTWESEQNGIRNQRLLGIERCYNDNESMIVIYVGPMMLAVCWLSK